MACIIERNREGVIGVAIIILKTKKEVLRLLWSVFLYFFWYSQYYEYEKGKLVMDMHYNQDKNIVLIANNYPSWPQKIEYAAKVFLSNDLFIWLALLVAS